MGLRSLRLCIQHKFPASLPYFAYAVCIPSHHLAGETENMKINPNADLRGIRPEEDLKEPTTFEITAPEDDDDCIVAEERKPKSGEGQFTQYMLHLLDEEKNHRVLRFLFESHLAPLAKAWGEDSVGWIGKKVVLEQEKITRDGKDFINAKLRPLEA
jgi:hypothetical protein